MRTYKVYGLEHLVLRRRRRKKASVYGMAAGGRYEHAQPNFEGGRACTGGGGGFRCHLLPVLILRFYDHKWYLTYYFIGIDVLLYWRNPIK